MFVRLDCCLVNLAHVKQVHCTDCKDGGCDMCIEFCDGTCHDHHFDSHDEAHAAFDLCCSHCDCCKCC